MRWISSGIDQLSGQTEGKVQLFIELSKQQQSGIGAKMFLHRFNLNAPFGGKIDFQIPNIVYNHFEPPSVERSALIVTS
jgi:hypothetical protein